MAPLDKDRWQAISPYLDRALEMNDVEREAWLAGLRVENPGLAADLESWFEDRRRLNEGEFLEGSARVPAEASLAGYAVGNYTLVSPIGQGGMGSVWVARRSDGRFEGTVAVKLLNAGLIGRSGEERFRREGSFLARLTHPHIAHLIDAGVSSMGQPYLVLEHVEGRPIDRYCDEHRLTIDARIRLFLDVLGAVAHAHAALIVHRDIKPSNVMVSANGSVKLLDFGIAKLLEGDAHGAPQPTALTREGAWALTPEYAAPEQVTGGAVTTATDVYALAILLYELLAGAHPAGTASRSPSDLLRAIVDTDPVRLSDSVAASHDRTPDTATHNAARRATTPDGLRHALRGDLDTILAKALKKDPAERYPSVSAFAEDLRRYLGHQPITARPDTFAYRAAKFTRRNRLPVALAAIAIVGVLAGLAGTVTQARRATLHAAAADAQRDFALRQLSRAEAINDLNMFVLSDAAPSGKPFTVGQLLARAEAIVEKQHGEADDNRVEMLVTIGRQYQVQDEDGNARRLLAKAHEISQKLPRGPAQAKAACALASAIASAGEFERAERLVLDALALLPDQPAFTIDRLFCLMRGSEVAREGPDQELGIARIEEARRVLAASAVQPAVWDLRLSMALAESYRMAARDRDAIAAFAVASQKLSALGRDDTQTAGTLLNNWALAVLYAGQPLEAERLFRRAIEISSADAEEQAVSPMLLTNYARTLYDLRRLPESRRYIDRAVAIARRAQDEIVLNHALHVQVLVYREMGDHARSDELLTELQGRWKRMMPPGHIVFGALASHQAALAIRRGDLEGALAATDRAVAIGEGKKDMVAIALYLSRRADLRRQLGRLEEARLDAERSLDVERRNAGSDLLSARVGQFSLTLARVLQAQGRSDEAARALNTAVEHLQATLGADHPQTLLARQLAAGGAGR